MWLHNPLYTGEGSMSGFLSHLSRCTMSKTCFHTNCPPASPLGLPASLAFVRAHPELWKCLKDRFSFTLRETDTFDVFLASNCGWCFLCGGGDRGCSFSVAGNQNRLCLTTTMKHNTPRQVFQPAANQRLSCRKITCKAFPFVVEEQRVTSYFFLFQKKKTTAGLSETLWIYP